MSSLSCFVTSFYSTLKIFWEWKAIGNEKLEKMFLGSGHWGKVRRDKEVKLTQILTTAFCKDSLMLPAKTWHFENYEVLLKNLFRKVLEQFTDLKKLFSHIAGTIKGLQNANKFHNTTGKLSLNVLNTKHFLFEFRWLIVVWYLEYFKSWAKRF